MEDRVLVSACLLGINCRYDGKSKADPGVMEEAAKRGWIPVCPEQLGGLTTPRAPSERLGDAVVSREGKDVTEAFSFGAEMVCELAKIYGAKYACLKEKSPSCGCGVIYDGTFTGTKIPGDGAAAEKLKAMGVEVYGESRVKELVERIGGGEKD